MNRRFFLGSAAVSPFISMSAHAAETPAHQWNLRYAPRLDFLSKELTIPQRLELFAQNGLHQFEYNGLPRHTNKEIEDIRKKMDELKFSMGVFVVNSGGWKGDAMVDKKFHAKFLDDVKRAVEIHKIIGNECATICSGLSVSNLSTAEQDANCVEVMKRAGELVEKTKLVLVLEPLNHLVDHDGYHVMLSDHGAELIKKVNHPQVKILFDMYHQQISEGFLIGHIKKHYAEIGYFQVGDVPGRKEPGTGEVNWRNVFKFIHSQGYKGILGMEHGLSVDGMAGLKKCFDEYRKADTWNV